MSGQSLPPEVIKWIQSLELTWTIKHPKWLILYCFDLNISFLILSQHIYLSLLICRDISNGYAIAEILSFYFSKEIEMHNYINGTALEIKQKNWGLLRSVSNCFFLFI